MMLAAAMRTVKIATSATTSNNQQPAATTTKTDTKQKQSTKRHIVRNKIVWVIMV